MGNSSHTALYRSIGSLADLGRPGLLSHLLLSLSLLLVLGLLF